MKHKFMQIKRLEDKLKVTTDVMSAIILQLKINRLKKELLLKLGYRRYSSYISPIIKK